MGFSVGFWGLCGVSDSQGLGHIHGDNCKAHELPVGFWPELWSAVSEPYPSCPSCSCDTSEQLASAATLQPLPHLI